MVVHNAVRSPRRYYGGYCDCLDSGILADIRLLAPPVLTICLHNNAHDLIAQVSALRGPWNCGKWHALLSWRCWEAFLTIGHRSFPRHSGMETAPRH